MQPGIYHSFSHFENWSHYYGDAHDDIDMTNLFKRGQGRISGKIIYGFDWHVYEDTNLCKIYGYVFNGYGIGPM